MDKKWSIILAVTLLICAVIAHFIGKIEFDSVKSTAFACIAYAMTIGFIVPLLLPVSKEKERVEGFVLIIAMIAITMGFVVGFKTGNAVTGFIIYTAIQISGVVLFHIGLFNKCLNGGLKEA
ncbi:MAG: hypothetical protein HYW78_03945 [Parcubacteria group bacterium]|nr:hypothetical protein [Parcubacteria group bacterium]